MITAFSADWHAARATVIGASEVAALYQCHPHVSAWALWHVKAGRIPPPQIDGQRPAWGIRLERAIAEAAAEANGWRLEPAGWMRDSRCERLGATPDFFITAAEGSRGVLECKNVDWLVHRRFWTEGEPPPHILLQLQAQLAVAGLAWGAVAALVGGNDLRVYRYEARPKLIADIRARVAAFWRSIDENRPPPIDGSDSAADALRALYPTLTEEPLDLRGDNRAPILCAEIIAAAERRREAEEREAALKAELRAMLGHHAWALVDGFDVRVAVTAAKPPTTITADMVGQTLPGRNETRRLIVKEKSDE